jgi:TPR repeat protein
MRGALQGAWLLVFIALLPGLTQAQQAAEPDLATLQASAQAGDSAAQFDLGNRYLYGTGMIADEFEAARWFRLAAEQGNNNAQYNLGVMYMQGTGVLADMNEALRWFLSAANLGDAPAQFTLATLYANGRGVPKDPVMAHMWFTLAASGGHRAAAANLVLYQEMMMDADIIEAQRLATEWIQEFNATLAARAGNDDNAVANPGTP